MTATIRREQLQEKIKNKDVFFLVETLPKDGFDHAHLPGALNLPPDRIAELAPALLPDRSAEIVVYCSSPN